LTRQKTEKSPGRTFGLATTLLPILQGTYADAQGDGEAGLAHAQECCSKRSHIAFSVCTLDNPLAYFPPDPEVGLADWLISSMINVMISHGTETSEHRRIGSVCANLVC
jgi:hypothetical protein